MASFECLMDLREKNKDLLMRLREQGVRLQTLTVRPSQPLGISTVVTPAGSRGSESGRANTRALAVTSSKLEDQAAQTDYWDPGEGATEGEWIVTLAGGQQNLARVALGRPKAQDTAEVTAQAQTVGYKEGKEDTLAFVTDSLSKTTTSSQGPRSQHVSLPGYRGLLLDKGNSCPKQAIISEATRSKPFLQTRLESGKCAMVSETQSMQPLLGYDWIAGLLDADSSLSERSEQFFTELRNFRQVNREECVHNQYAGLEDRDPTPSPLSTDVNEPERTQDVHKCTFCYRINSRLFPEPLDSKAACPVCKLPKSKHAHTQADPAFIRISIPRSTLLPAHRYRVSRRSSFDEAHSLGLASHCLSGWSNTPPTTASRLSSLDLRSSLDKLVSAGFPPSQPKDQMDLSVSRIAGNQRSDDLLDVSRLARYHFYHFGRSKSHGAAYPVY